MSVSWALAVEAFRRADARVEALPPGTSDELYDPLAEVRYAAVMRLLLTPAPDLPALSLKIDLIVDEDAASLNGAEAIFALLKADGRRLLKEQEGLLYPPYH